MLDQPRPDRRVPEILRCPHHRGEKLPRVVRPEAETVPRMHRRVEVPNRVGQAARGTHHRDRSVAKCDQLRQAARLKARRHPQHVRAGVDALREGRVEPHGYSHLARHL